MKLDVQIRRASPADFAALGDAFRRSVREGAGQYTGAQRAAWPPAPRAGEAWAAHPGAQAVRLPETDARPLGFLTLTPDGDVDLACILAEAQGQGLFRRLWTDASLHAKGPLTGVGFTAAYAEMPERASERLKRLRMEKRPHG